MQPVGKIRASAEAVANKAVWLYRLRALLWLSVTAVVVTAGFVLVDYWLNVEEQAFRWLLSLLWFGLLVALARYWLADAWQFRLSALQVARWLETSKPEMADGLSNLLATEQLPASDLRYGSHELRQAALSSAAPRLEQVAWHGLVDNRAVLIAVSAGLAAISIVGLSLLSNRALTLLSVQRIIAPWKLTPWPRSDQLELVDLPMMIPINHELEVKVIDNNPPLPVDVKVELRTSADGASGQTTSKTAMQMVDGMAVCTLPAAERDFEIRVLGGDQRDSAWHLMRVARKPTLVQHQFTIEPPLYTSQSRLQLVGQRIDILAGSRVTFRGLFDIPVSTVVAVPMSTTQTAGEVQGDQVSTAVQWKCVLDASGTSFDLNPAEADTLIQLDQMWKLEVTTQDGLVVRDDRTWHLRVIADQAPTILLNPLAMSSITRHASLSITGHAADDLGLTEVALLSRLGDAVEPLRTTIWSFSDNISKEQRQTEHEAQRRSLDVVANWPADHDSLLVGQRVSLELEAVDSAGQKSRSLVQSLEVVDDQSLLAQLQLKQAEVFSSLREVAQSQNRATHILQRTQEVMRAASQVDHQQLESLSATQQIQNSVADELVRSAQSVRGQLTELSQQLDRNNLSGSQLAQDIAALAQQIDEIGSESMAPALEQLSQANQAMDTARQDPSQFDQATEKLGSAVSASRQLSSQIDHLTDSAESVETLAELQKQFQQLLTQQQAVRDATEKLQVDSLTVNNPSQVTSQHAGVRSDQQDLARHGADLLNKIDHQLAASEKADGTAAQTSAFVDTLKRIRAELLQQQVVEHMREASESIEDNQLADGLLAQQSSIDALKDIVSQFSPAQQNALEGASQAMDRLSEQLDALATRQKKMADQLNRQNDADQASNSQPLIQDQQKLSQEINQFANRTTAAQNQAMQDSLENATQQSQSAAQSAEERKFQQASKQAEEAASQLRTAQQQASQRADQLRQQLSQQQLLDLATLLGTLVNRQTGVVEELKRIPVQVEADDLKTLPNLITQQQQSLNQLRNDVSKDATPDAFAWLLEQCDEELVRSLAALERKRVHPEGLGSAENALNMFRAAQSALAKDGKSPASENDNQADSSNAASDEPKPNKNVSLTSLKLLREMQTLLNEQSERLLLQSMPDVAALELVAQRQRSLAEQVEQIMKATQR